MTPEQVSENLACGRAAVRVRSQVNIDTDTMRVHIRAVMLDGSAKYTLGPSGWQEAEEGKVCDPVLDFPLGLPANKDAEYMFDVFGRKAEEENLKSKLLEVYAQCDKLRLELDAANLKIRSLESPEEDEQEGAA